MRKDSIIAESDSPLRIVQIQADDGPWWRVRNNTIEVAKRTVPDDLCDTRDHLGCGGSLYRWTQRTTLEYFPVVRCENHLKLQCLWQQYQDDEWAKISDGPCYDEKMRPLPFCEWLAEHWNDDISEVDIGPYWELV